MKVWFILTSWPSNHVLLFLIHGFRDQRRYGIFFLITSSDGLDFIREKNINYENFV